MLLFVANGFIAKRKCIKASVFLHLGLETMLMMCGETKLKFLFFLKV